MDPGKLMKILIAEPDGFSKKALSLLNELGDVTCYPLAQEDVQTALTNYDVIWIRLGLTIRKNDLPSTLHCKFIISATTGLNHIDVEEINKAGCKVLSLKGKVKFLEKITATAEHTIGLLLSLVRMIPAAHTSVLNGNWKRDFFKGRELSGKIFGILGYGRLGKIVAKYCKAFDMKIMVYDPFVIVHDHEIKCAESAEELFQSADYITIHIPLNDATYGLIGKKLLGLMKPDSCLVNTSRGEIIVEADLLTALKQKTMAGAALDVVNDEESFSESNPLVQYAQEHDNLLITPHIGGCTSDSMEKCEEFMAQLLKMEELS